MREQLPISTALIEAIWPEGGNVGGQVDPSLLAGSLIASIMALEAKVNGVEVPEDFTDEFPRLKAMFAGE